ncbi:MAG TPA: chemotaxis-specific protein-glutamate methyltransferase CheB [Candidatus Omnitrophota bacterium]|nr:chemotaxis-specific protein-glutamate methyltransferase CheB [Candidatus Omnitrophota bacterium]
MADIIKVLIVDDSPFIREALKSILEQDPDIKVVGLAKNGREALEAIRDSKPNVVTMDIKMPVMDGFDAIEAIMTEQPVPVIVVSTSEVDTVVRALNIGAMDFVSIRQGIDEIARELVYKIKIASKVKALKRLRIKPLEKAYRTETSSAMKIIAIGVSTGGPQALQIVLSKLPQDLGAGILIVQHMSKGFIEGMAEWLRAHSRLAIRVAREGDVLKPGMVLFAPDGCHMLINYQGKIILQADQESASVHIPSIDVTMKAVAEAYREHAIGVIMTGMGHDGVEGIRAIKKAGGKTISQDEHSSVIFGMNKLAIEAGSVDQVASLDDLADAIIRML